jgi:hypothetical protein
VAMEMEQQKCSNVLNLTSTHFFNLTRAFLIAKTVRVAINKKRMKKKDNKKVEA